MPIGDFTAQADAYRWTRPSYPPAMLDALAAELELRPRADVADIGAGTGIFTRLLAERGYRVAAIEPNEAMRRHAEPDARVRWVDGTFAATGLPSRSQDWVAAAQAFHWAEPQTALPELRRILRPDCAFTALWNDRDHDGSEALRFVRETIQRHVPGFDETYRDRDWTAELTAGGFFDVVAYREVRHVVRMTRDRFIALWRGHNLLNNTAGPVRFEGFLADVIAYLDEHHLDEVDVSYRCRAWTAR